MGQKAKGSFKVKAEMPKVDEMMKSILTYGAYMDKKDTAEDNWNSTVISRLTGAQSSWFLSENEFDDVKIANNIESLKKQHETYQLNDGAKYAPGMPAYDAVQKTIDDQTYQYNKALNFQKDYQEILAANDFSVEERLVPQYDASGAPIMKDLHDQSGNPVYNINEEGRVDYDSPAQEHVTRMMTDWDVLQDEVINKSQRNSNTGDIFFTDKTRETTDNMIERIRSNGTRMFDFKEKYSKWIDNDMAIKLSTVHALDDEQMKKLQQIDDSFGGDFITNKPYFERLAIALQTDTWKEFDTENSADRESRRQVKSGIISERDKLRDDYVKSHMRMNAERLLKKAPKSSWENPNVPEYEITWENSAGEPTTDNYTKAQIIGKFGSQHHDLVTQVAGFEWQLQQGWGRQRDTLLMGSDRNMIDKFGQESYINRNVKGGAKTTQKKIVDDEVDDNAQLTTPLNKKAEMKNVHFAKDEISGRIDNVNESKSELENWTYKPVSRGGIPQKGITKKLLNILDPSLKRGDKPLTKKELFKLKEEFENDVKNHNLIKEAIKNINQSGLSDTQGPWYWKQFSDIGKERQRLREELSIFEKKWGSRGRYKLQYDTARTSAYREGDPSVLKGGYWDKKTMEWGYNPSAANSAYTQLNRALNEYGYLEWKIKKETELYTGAKQASLNLKK